MNRRNFFSLAALSLGGLICGRGALRPTPTPTPTVRPADLGHLQPFTPEEKLQDSMLKGYYADAVRLPASHSHSINDPGHSHAIANPNWIPCDKPMHYVHYDVL